MTRSHQKPLPLMPAHNIEVFKIHRQGIRKISGNRFTDKDLIIARPQSEKQRRSAPGLGVKR